LLQDVEGVLLVFIQETAAAAAVVVGATFRIACKKIKNKISSYFCYFVCWD